jgi:hypothetical protein
LRRHTFSIGILVIVLAVVAHCSLAALRVQQVPESDRSGFHKLSAPDRPDGWFVQTFRTAFLAWKYACHIDQICKAS